VPAEDSQFQADHRNARAVSFCVVDAHTLHHDWHLQKSLCYYMAFEGRNGVSLSGVILDLRHKLGVVLRRTHGLSKIRRPPHGRSLRKGGLRTPMRAIIMSSITVVWRRQTARRCLLHGSHLASDSIWRSCSIFWACWSSRLPQSTQIWERLAKHKPGNWAHPKAVSP
jgi:hypothetical protein